MTRHVLRSRPEPLRRALLLASLSLCATSFAMAASPSTPSAPSRYEPDWQSLDRRPMPDWFLDAKFGIFIHWGVYSVPAWGKVGEYAEWYWHFLRNDNPNAHGGRDELNRAWRDFHHRVYGADFDYQDFAPRFQAELFDAREWAELFRRSGARYVVPTSKHHEGFALWPSAEASRTWGRPWNSVEIGPRRDLMLEMAEATRAAGLRFGFYYSLYEWFNPLWLQDRRRYVDEHMIPQFKDVVTRYQPSIIFSDGEWDLPSSEWKSEELLAWLFNESAAPTDVVINDRWGKETRHRHGGYWTTEYTPGLSNSSHPWEESRGMGFSYGHNRAERAHHYKSADELILVLIDIVSRGGNLLLDIGPAADGTIPPIMEERLLAIGAWLERNGEAVYGTRAAARAAQWTEGERPEMAVGEFRVDYPLLEQVGQAPREGRAVKQVFFTQKSDSLYAITAGWPGQSLVLRGIRTNADTQVRLVGMEGDLPLQRDAGTLTIQLPELSSEQLGQPAHALKITGAELLPE